MGFQLGAHIITLHSLGPGGSGRDVPSSPNAFPKQDTAVTSFKSLISVHKSSQTCCLLEGLPPNKSDDNLITCKMMVELDDHFPPLLDCIFHCCSYLCWSPSHLSPLQFLCQNPPPSFQGQKFPSIMAVFWSNRDELFIRKVSELLKHN